MNLPAIGQRLKRLFLGRRSRGAKSVELRISPAEQPLRSELYSVDQLARHAGALARSHRLATARPADRLLPRLDDNEQVLVETHDLVTAAVLGNRRIAPAAEWLLDNFYLIEEQIRTARRHLPKSYGRELPCLGTGPLVGYPRVYAIALELISHVDGRIDSESLNAFIKAYQVIVPLTMGELWAVPIVLRLALIENLRRVAVRIGAGRRDRDAAVDWAGQMLRVVEEAPTNLILVMADMARADVPLSGAFLAELTRHLQGQSPHLAFATSWLEHRLADQGLTIGQLVSAEGNAQAVDQVSVGNCITSLRFLSSTDWRDFVEAHSIVERELRADPAGVYAGMTFATRDRYRHAVEQVARRSRLSEHEVARKAIGLARMGESSTGASLTAGRAAHVGYYLIDRGRPALERIAEMRRSSRTLAGAVFRQAPFAFYLSAILLIAAIVLGAFIGWSGRAGMARWLMWSLALPATLAATHVSAAVVNWLATLLVHPRQLPRMDFRDGVPPEHRTLVVVPTMLSSPEGIQGLLDGLEVRFLANMEGSLHFALLTDWEDGTEERKEADDELLRLAREGIEELNQKYRHRPDVFFLLHRPRRWNASDAIWMGYERKRGKLADLNAFLRGATGRFSLVVGEQAVLRGVRYVITLDTDTQLPRGAAAEMAGAMAHILNRPVFDGEQRRVVAGHAILQPRVGVSLPTARRSWFVRLFAGNPGVDPYTRMISDVYQDLFGEGSFIGKGIYDVDAFAASCECLPENAILSHDLIEGAYARSALLSDVELYEEYPSRYPADVSRRHRWMRGDWQIAGWLLPSVRGPGGERVRNPISALSRWKILDNLRRSLMPMALLLLFLAAWLLMPPAQGVAAVTLALAAIGAGAVVAAIGDAAGKPADLPLIAHLRATWRGLGNRLAQFLFSLVFLPYDAYVSADAIARTAARMLWTRRRLLEWKTSSDAHRAARGDLAGSFRSLWFAPSVALATPGALAIFRPDALPWAAPFLGLWLVSPIVGWWLSRPLPPPQVRLSDDQRRFLEKLGRRTWRFFEVLVTPGGNWLPPDNVQELPSTIVAPRTSPTNIGMALLADLAAYDFGYCPAGTLIDRTRNTFATLARLERHRGHFYNWYDIHTLKPLAPLYVSTVDSGNLAGHLLVLRQGLLELFDAPVLPPRAIGGIRDTLAVLLDAARGLHVAAGDGPPPAFWEVALTELDRFEAEIPQTPGTLSATVTVLSRLAASAAKIALIPGADEEQRWWAAALERTCAGHRDELATCASWSTLVPPSAPVRQRASPEQLALLEDLEARLDRIPTLRQVAAAADALVPLVDSLLAQRGGHSDNGQEGPATLADWGGRLRCALLQCSGRAADRIKALADLANECLDFAQADVSFLYDKSRHLLAIGYNVADHRLDAGFYDLLASEARLGSFVAIAQGQLGQEHWFALGRLLTTTDTAPALLSWSGSMFEFLMPLLVMPTYENTLLDQTCKAIVGRQIQYGRLRGVPWGISESGYNTTDQHMTYQYRAFGVPGLGLKRGLSADLVIAPYATALALMVAPREACRNLQRLAADGRQGKYGMYEAIDYTPSRLGPGSESATVEQFMAHHQGMSLLSLAYVLLDKPMQRRFAGDPALRAADLLLQERVPRESTPIFPHAAEAGATRPASAEEEGTLRVYTDPGGAVPETHLLSNGRYHVVVTAAGGGYSRWRDTAITRWREDPTRDCWGSFCYLRDVSGEGNADREGGAFWSTTWQPGLRRAKGYEAIFTQDRAEFRRRDGDVETHTQITVSPEDDIELRRVTLTNRSDVARSIEVTSYSEVVLAPAAHDLAHPAFSNLFVQTELVPDRGAILCTRRPRSTEERPPWMVHLMTVRGAAVGEASFETDRMRFLGRGRTVASPVAMEHAGPLSGAAGAVLDPIVAIRHTIRLEPGERASIDLITGVGETREAVTAITNKYHDPRLADRVFELAYTHGQVLLRQLNATDADAQVYGRLAGSVIYASSLRRAKPTVLARNRRGQSGLWGYGISGDLPIVVLRIRDTARVELVRQALQAHAYWRLKGLIVDLVVWNEDDSVYRQTLQDAIMNLVATSADAALVDKPGGIFVRRGEQMSEEDRALLQTVARVVLLDEAGTLREQVERRGRTEVPVPALKPSRRRPEHPPAAVETPHEDLAFYNGLGGFTRDGREYIIHLPPGGATPAPWVNVIANPRFGTVVSEAGSAYTWAENCHEFRLTPWHNDPVSDTCGEALYIRDEETGRFWSPSPSPARGAMAYVARHGFGYTIFEYEEDGVRTELCFFVPTDAPVKIARLRVTNRSGRRRQLSVTGYWEWVLGELGDKTHPHVVTELDAVSGAILARNRYSAEFARKIAFADCSEPARTVTADRTEFLGRNGTPAHPAALRRTRLSGRVGAGLDPCAAIQVPVNLDDEEVKDVVFVIGAADDELQARHLAQRFRDPSGAQGALEGVWAYWASLLGAVYVETPDPATNFLANGWLIYQTLACRMWGRTGYYQSGGAYGFRDQLQDAAALVHAAPDLLREHLLRAAAHQFREGDVQHWWHPPGGRGVRTHFSDDFLWLPWAACRYVAATGDTGVLDERVAFLAGRALRPEEEAYYDLPKVADDVGTLYEHCRRAIDNGLRFGAHGLPLIGSGDWNDGMNRVGEAGKGESVWLAFFLFDVLTQFAALARHHGDAATADRFLTEAAGLRGRIEQNAWDGNWYRRAYFDDGQPLGSATNDECQIDSIPQSWSILSGAGAADRSRLAMEHVDQRLVNRAGRQIRLFDPPFNKSPLNPGYIKGYPPGVRENGGQYTHAAIWTVMAFAAVGDAERAWELYSLINPIGHAATPAGAARYRVEPYVVAADVYGVPPHTGRGGWTWYTGSAGWMYRLITESILGLRLETNQLRFVPCVPAEWPSYKVHYRYRETFYHITIHNDGESGGARIILDGAEQPGGALTLVDDRRDHHAEVHLAATATDQSLLSEAPQAPAP